MITKQMTINEMIRLHPESMEVLNRFDVDLCCGGNRTIEAAASEDGVVLDDLLAALNAAAH
jgi:regulator of cell morphogenesis and NO signaling